MLDVNGKLIRLGDRITIGSGINGVVVFSIDTNEFSAEFLKEHWEYLGRGIMVQTEGGELVHLDESDEDTEIIPPFQIELRSG